MYISLWAWKMFVSKYINLEVLLLATWGFERPNFLRSVESTEFQDLNCTHESRLKPEMIIVMQ